MEDLRILYGAEPRKILQRMIEEQFPAVMTYLSRGRWHVAKVVLCDLGEDELAIELLQQRDRQPINVKPGLSIGISLKYEYDKLIFNTEVLGLEPSTDGGGGIVIAQIPKQVQMVGRRNYFRVEVPPLLKVGAKVWHCQDLDGNALMMGKNCIDGTLVDISAGGIQVAFDASEKTKFKTGQFVGLRFTPLPGELPMTVCAQIRTILPTANQEHVCFGLQMVGLEANNHGRDVLIRLVGIVEQYFEMNKSRIRTQEF